jgi:hypothetical protein
MEEGLVNYRNRRISEEHEGIGVQHFSPSAGMAGISEKP